MDRPYYLNNLQLEHCFIFSHFIDAPDLFILLHNFMISFYNEGGILGHLVEIIHKCAALSRSLLALHPCSSYALHWDFDDGPFAPT